MQSGNLILLYNIIEINKFGCPKFNFFATRINKQLQDFFFYYPEPKAKAIDAFLTDWGKQFSYMFPPFSLLGKVASKI